MAMSAHWARADTTVTYRHGVADHHRFEVDVLRTGPACTCSEGGVSLVDGGRNVRYIDLDIFEDNQHYTRACYVEGRNALRHTSHRL